MSRSNMVEEPKLKSIVEDNVEMHVQLMLLLKASGTAGISINKVVELLGDTAAIMSGILTAKGEIQVIGGGGKDPYILALK